MGSSPTFGTNLECMRRLDNGYRSNRFPNEKVFVENSTYKRGHLKARIITEKLIPYECAKCRLGDQWNGEKLVLRLDHKNGVNNDHRFGNLRFLCPNCDSQEPTFCGRNKKKK